MAYLGFWQIDDMLTFVVTTQAATTGIATDADAVPSYRIYEDETAVPILTGSMAKLDDANTIGFYSEQITLSAANGFELGKAYSVYIEYTVTGSTRTESFTFQMEDIENVVWDAILTGTTHNIATSAGKRLRELASTVIYANTAQGGTASSITLDVGASATDGAYDPALIAIVLGTGAGQSRNIFEYDGTTKVACVDRDWKVIPDDTSQFIIYADAGREHVNEGKAQGGTATTITLNPLASSADDAYNDQTVFIRAGTGADQVRYVTDYNGTTKVATVDRAWDVTPDTASVYVMLPSTTITPADVWSYTDRTFTRSVLAIAAAVAGNTINIVRGDTLSAAITNIGDLTGYTSIDWTVKVDLNDSDDDAILRVRLNSPSVNDGLLRVNGAAAADSSKGSITVDDIPTGDITIAVAADITNGLVVRNLHYDIQVIKPAGVTTLAEGQAIILPDATRAVV